MDTIPITKLNTNKSNRSKTFTTVSLSPSYPKGNPLLAEGFMDKADIFYLSRREMPEQTK
jgi:hypothetical protein